MNRVCVKYALSTVSVRANMNVVCADAYMSKDKVGALMIRICVGVTMNVISFVTHLFKCLTT